MGFFNNMGFFGKSNDDENQKEKKLTIKSLWKRIPFTVKMWIFIGLGFAIFILLLITIIASIPNNFLDFSKDAEATDDFKKEYEEYWIELCEEGGNCSEEELEAAKELQESQEAFYKKLDTLAKKEKITEEQKQIVLTTIFYNYEIDDFTRGNNAFDLDDNDEIDYSTEGKNAYEMEKDSLKELIKQFKVTAAFCNWKDEEGNAQRYDLRDADGKTFSFNFFDGVKFALGIDPKDEGFTEAKISCLSLNEGRVTMETSSDSATSIEGYYDYLRESEYLDKRPQNKPIYDEYAAKNHLSEDISTWTDEDKLAVREKIINNIKDIVANHRDNEKKDETYIAFGAETAYWWPIGSAEVTEHDGKYYAREDPISTAVTSEFGWRTLNGSKNYHSAIDIAPYGGLPAGTVPVIAAKSGEVVFPDAGVPVGYGNQAGINGSTYGNYIIIRHTDGNYTLYAHLHANTIMVRTGDTVEQGQVIAYMGNSGNSYGAHLHFEIREGQNSYNSVVNPRGYVDLNDPRPQSSIDSHFLEWFSKNFEGSTPLDPTGTKYLVQDVGDGVPTAGPGVNMHAQRRKFEQRGLNYLDYPIGTYVDKKLIDDIRMQVLEENFSTIEATLANGGLTLEKEKIEALGVHMYNTGNISGFVDAYKKYGDTDALFENYFLPSAKVHGEVWPGLVKRRQMEWELFHNHVYVGE